MAFENPNQWNHYYEAMWDARTKLIRDIIADGETHPLRVLGRFESVQRYSKFEGQFDNVSSHTDVSYNLDGDVNIERNEQGRITRIVVQELPTGLQASMDRIYGDSKIISSTLLERGHINLLVDYLRRHEFDAVVELGSGLGTNLVKLFYQGGPRVPYYACEYTESGYECSKLLAGLTDEFDLRPHRFDHTDPDLSFLQEKGRIFYFTCHSVEQVEKIPQNLLSTIALSAAEVRCMHLEPCGWQFAAMTNTMTQLDHDQRDFFVKRGWNMNLVPELLRADSAGEIRFKFFGKNMIQSSDSVSGTSIAIWDSPAASS